MVRSRFAGPVLVAATLALILIGPPTLAHGQEPEKTASGPDEIPPPVPRARATARPDGDPGTPVVGRRSIMALVTGANPMFWLLGLCSVVTVGYTLERLIGLRRGRVIPRDFVNRFLERLGSGKLDRERASEFCRSNESPAARIFGHAVRHWGQPASTIRQAVDLDAAREVLDLRRNVRVLNGTATLAPLLGLLGTVLGMIQSFDAIGGRVGGAKSEALAQGISLALVSTAVGLGVAIASVAAYYFLLNRVDLLVRDLDDQLRRVIDQISAEALRPQADRRVDIARVESRIGH